MYPSQTYVILVSAVVKTSVFFRIGLTLGAGTWTWSWQLILSINIWCHFSTSSLSVHESNGSRTEKSSSPINFWQKLLALMKDCWCIESAARVMIYGRHLLAGSAVQSKIYRRTFISNKYCNETPPPKSLLSNSENCTDTYFMC